MNTISIIQIARLILLRGLGVCLQVLMQFAIARVAGSAGIGVMQIYQTWTCVLGETTAVGLPTQTMKSVSVTNNGRAIILRLKRSLQLIFVIWLVLVSLFALASILFSSWIAVSTGNQFAMAWSVLCFAILRVSAEALKAMNCSDEGIFFENSVVPFLMVVFCIILAVAGVQPLRLILGNVSIVEMLIYAASLFLTIAAACSLARCLRHAKAKDSVNELSKAEKAMPLFTEETRFFWGTSILSIGFLNLPFLLMPSFGSVEEIGLFALAFKCINPISTILIMLGALFGPRFAQAIIRSESAPKNLRSLLLQSQLVSIGLYLPILLPILFFAEPILSIFGEEFRSAKTYLFILAAAQLVNALTGLSGNMLNMIGLGKREFQGSLIFCVVAIFSGVWAGTNYGLAGVAIAYSASLAGKNLWSYCFAIAATRAVTPPSSNEFKAVTV